MAYHKNATQRLERLLAMLQQSQELILGLGQYVPENDSNRQVMIAVCANNHAVIQQEEEALRAESVSSVIWTPEELNS